MDNNELLNAISEIIESKMRQELKPINDKLDKIENEIVEIKEEIVEMKIDLRLVKIATASRVKNAEDLENLKVVK